jgi:acyl-CoA synthetase (AMP-forming)/AMP-acid ligase II
VTVLARVVAEAAARFGSRPALVPDGGRPLTYDELHVASDAVAAALADEGVGEAAVVGLDHRSDVDWVVAFVALAKVGAVASGINPRLAPAERASVLARLGADRVIGDGEVGELLARGRGRVLVDVPPADPDRPSVVVFTSGTTGEPKGAEFREAQLDAVAAIDLGERAAAWGGGGPMLASTQFAHVGFATKLPWYLRTGATVHVLDRWRAADALRVIARERMRSIGGVAAQIGLLLREPSFDDLDLSAVETIVVGAGPSPAAIVTEARRRFDAAYSIRYSSTESGGVGTATAFDADDDEALHSVGRPRPGVAVRVDPATGVLELRSPAVMAGYWRDPTRTSAAFTDDGWLRTGDLASIDERGLVRLHGRATDMYIRGGYNVHPAEVEAVLLEHPAVAQVAVVARPDEVMGERGVAVVVPADRRSPPNLDELRAFAAGRLASYKLPEHLLVRDELPLTTMDKVDRRLLAAEVGRIAVVER